MKKFLLILFLSMSASANAYLLDGIMIHNHGGVYILDLETSSGHEYDGEAIRNPDGSLYVNVEDNKHDSYSGLAVDTGNGTFLLDLENDRTGKSAEGTVILVK